MYTTLEHDGLSFVIHIWCLCSRVNRDEKPSLVAGAPWYAVPGRTIVAGNQKLAEATREVQFYLRRSSLFNGS